MNINDEKKRLREVARDARKRAADNASDDDLAAFHANLRGALSQLPNWQCISGYLAIGDEIDILPVLKALREDGKTCLLPVVTGNAQPLIFRVWEPGAPLEKGPLNTRHPARGAEATDPDILLVPLLAFDKTGYRLGWGGGFYDRTLAGYQQQGRAVTSIGVAYAAQEVDHVPRDDYDVPLDWVVTETNVTEITANKKA